MLQGMANATWQTIRYHAPAQNIAKAGGEGFVAGAVGGAIIGGTVGGIKAALKGLPFSPPKVPKVTVTRAGTAIIELGPLEGEMPAWENPVTGEPIPAKPTVQSYPKGTFSVADWGDYPSTGNVPKPNGPFRLLEGTEYENARKAANQANSALRRSGVVPKGYEIHEIQPVKFGGSPTDLANKIALPKSVHSQYTTWWRTLQRNLLK